MSKYIPADLTAGINRTAWPNLGEGTDEVTAPGFPAIQRSLATVTATGTFVGDADAFDEPGGTAHSEGHIEAWDGTDWNILHSESITAPRDSGDSYNTSGTWTRVLSITDLSDVKVRVRGTASCNSANSSANAVIDITGWFVELRRRNQPAMV